MQLLSVANEAPQPELSVIVQLFNVLESTPPPVFPDTTQLFSAQPPAPPPQLAVLPVSVQLFSVPP
jgi:hypothetical protein